MRSLRHTWKLLPIAFLSQAFGCVAYLARAEVEEHKSASFERIALVSVDTRNGLIDVRCDPACKDVEIRAVKFARGLTQDDARDHADSIEIEAAPDVARPDRLNIAAHVPLTAANRSAGASFHIILPPGAALRLNSSNGALRIEGADHDVTAVTSNGRIEVRNVRGDVELRTSNGDIVIKSAGRARVHASTSNGGIRAEGVAGDASLHSSNGSIDLQFASVTEQPNIEAVTSNGNVLLKIPPTTSARLTAHTHNGRVHSHLNNFKLIESESRSGHFQATLNEGKGTVRVESRNGSITLQSL